MTWVKTWVSGLAAVAAPSFALAAEGDVATGSWSAPVGILIFLVAFGILVFALSRLVRPDAASQYRYWRESKDNPVVPFDGDFGDRPN